MNELRYTIRAMIAMAVMVSLVILLGGFALIVRAVHPSQRLMDSCSLFWARAVLLFSGVRLTIKGQEKAAGFTPAFFIGNHQSGLDIPIVICALEGHVRFLAKDSLFRIPLFGRVIRRHGFVPIDRQNVRRTLEALKHMIAVMHSNPISMTAFPEGTRSRDGRLLPFRRGTMKIAQRAGLPVVPFAIDGSILVHHPDRMLRTKPGPVTLTFAEPIPADQVVAMGQGELHGRVVSAIANALGQPVPETQEELIDASSESCEVGACL